MNTARSALIALLALIGLPCLALIPSFVGTLRPGPDRILDFFQEWASARNVYRGWPVYTPQAVTARAYLNFRPPADRPTLMLPYNAHPPPAVLLALPLGALDYSDAFLFWSLLSLVCFGISVGLVFGQLGIRWPLWFVLPAIGLLLICNPFRQQVTQGQLNLVLLLLLTGVWTADRNDWPRLAGLLLGTATALKLFPGFLFLYFALRRQWSALALGAVAVLGWTVLTGSILGWDTYRDYVQTVLPDLACYQGWWPNVSLVGFWGKLFGTEGKTIPLWPSPLLARGLALASIILVTGLAGGVIVRARNRADRDWAFGVTLIAMVLASPIAWDHYFLLLLLPVTLLWQRLPPVWTYRLVYGLALVIGWTTPILYWRRFIPGVTPYNWLTLTADPLQTLTALAFPTYALLGLYALGVLLEQGETEAAAESPKKDVPEDATAACAPKETELPALPAAPPDEAKEPVPTRDFGWLKPIGILLLAGLSVYHNSFTGAFLLDDIPLMESPAIAQLGGVSWYNWVVRPVLYRSMELNYWLEGTNVRGYHVVNLLIHVAAACTLFGLVRQTLLRPRYAKRYATSAAPLALAIALLWLVHPLNTQSVTYIIQRSESFMGLCYLLVLYCLVRGHESACRWAWYAAALVSCALGMGSKQVIATAPLVALLYDGTFLESSWRRILRERWMLYLGLVAIVASLTALEVGFSTPTAGGAGFGLPTITPLQYARTQPEIILHYLRLAIWPVGLCLDYNDWPVVPTWAAAAPALAAIAALLLGTLVGLWRRSGLGFLGAAFFLILAPSSSIMPIADLAFEHRMYLPLACVVTLAVLAGYHGLEFARVRLNLPRAVVPGVGGSLVALLAGVLGYLTIERNEVYRSEAAMYQDVVAKRPGNARAWGALGRLALRQGRLEEALAYFRRALAINPGYAMARNNAGVVYQRQGRLTEAVQQHCLALQIEPTHHAARDNLAAALLRQGQTVEAIDQLKQAIALAPQVARYHYDLATALTEQGAPSQAALEYAEGRRLDPGWPREAARRAWRLATAVDPSQIPAARAEALFLARQACQAMGDEAPAELLDVRAAAEAANEQFDAAIATARLALARAKAAGNTELQRRIQDRLELYERRRPFRLDP